MKISLAIRGQEHINSTFPQMNLFQVRAWWLARSHATHRVDRCVVAGQVLEWKPPAYAHLPLIMSAEGEKLSKRKHDSVRRLCGCVRWHAARVRAEGHGDGGQEDRVCFQADVVNHKKNGILKEALLNYVAKLGWGYGNEEIFTLEQACEPARMSCPAPKKGM